MVPATVSPPASPPKPWQPDAFDLDVKQLPANFAGTDPARFVKLFKSISDKNQKGEYETTAKYRARVKDLKAVLAPLSPDAPYAFVFDVWMRYNADHGAFEQQSGYCDGDTELGSLEAPAPACKIFTDVKEHETYVGSNAFGATKVVEKTRGDYYVLAMKRSTVGRFLHVDRYSSIFEWKMSCPAAPDHAKSLDDKHVQIALAGRLTGAQLLSGQIQYESPKITDSSPKDLLLHGYGIPFQPVEAICFVRETGEILARVNVGTKRSRH